MKIVHKRPFETSIKNLQIPTYGGNFITSLTPIQQECFNHLITGNDLYCVKCRQAGFTTLALLYSVYLAKVKRERVSFHSFNNICISDFVNKMTNICGNDWLSYRIACAIFDEADFIPMKQFVIPQNLQCLCYSTYSNLQNSVFKQFIDRVPSKLFKRYDCYHESLSGQFGDLSVVKNLIGANAFRLEYECIL